MEARDIRRIARENLAGNWWLSVGVALLASILGGLITAGGASVSLNLDERELQRIPREFIPALKFILGTASTVNLLHFILGGTIQLGYCRYLLKQHDRADFQFNDLFSQFDNFGKGFLQNFLRGLFVFLWSLLFIIPGIVKSYAYSMTPFILTEHPEMTANEAITASRELMNGHKGELFWLDLTFIGWSLLCAFTLGIGNLFLNPYMNASRAAFYRDLTRN